MRSRVGIVMVVWMVGRLSWAGNLAPNSTFEEGTDSPAGWNLVGGKGQFESTCHTGRGISVTGTGQDNPYWTADAKGIQVGKAYRLSFQARTTGSGGNMICGLDHINRDYQPGSQWAEYTYIFTPKKDPRGCIIRLGQWQRNDTTFFDNVSLTEVTPIHDRNGSIELGEGESIRDGIYSFNPDFNYEGSNSSRPLVEFTGGFNTNRWTFGPGEWLVYRHRVGDVEQTDPTVRVNVGHYSSGQCIVECSGDAKSWKELGRIGKVETQSFTLPKELSGQKDVWIRIRGSAANDPQGAGSFQVYGYTYSARLDQPVPDVAGQTRFVEILQESKGPIEVELLSCGSLIPDDNQIVRFRVKNRSAEEQVIRGQVSVPYDTPETVKTTNNSHSADVVLAPNSEKIVDVKYNLRRSGTGSLQANVELRKKGALVGETFFSAKTTFSIPALYDAMYGHIGESIGPLSWWWCEGTYKVSRQRPTPTGPVKPTTISACRGEYEPVQIVLRPTEPLKQVTISIEGNQAIPTSAVKAHRVAYHYVHRTSDPTGWVGWWPDALPEWKEPVDLTANENQPIWVLVKIPRECKERSSQIQLKIRAANQPEVTIPIHVRVYDFEMPQRSHIESGFGISPGNIRRYHNLQTQEEERQVWDLYMQSFREHRIAPYNFAPYDPMGVKWVGMGWEGGRILDSGSASGVKCLMVEDNNAKGAVNSSFPRFVPIEKGKAIRLLFKSRTETAGQPYLVTLNTYDKNQEWISGHNIDLPQTGNGKWQSHDLRIVPSERSPDAAFVRLTVWAAPYSDTGEATGIVWFDDLSLKVEGSETEWISNGGFEEADSLTAELDFAAWDKQAEQYLNRADGFNSFMLPLQGTGGGTYESRSPGKIGPFEQGTDGYRKAFASYCGAIQQHLQDKGWLGREYIYWFDEPEPKDYDFVRAGMDEIHRAGPKLRRMLTEEPIEPLFGSVDLWCPILDQYNPEAAQARQAKDETIWWYVCTGPRAPYPGLFIDHSAIDLRMWLWMTWKWQVQGILVWESTYWTSDKAFPAPKMQNPWADPMGYIGGYSFEPGFVGYWGNGDGRFLYPPNRDVENDKSKFLTGPVSSIRWEMLREGLEDYEYFWLLREAVDKAEKVGKHAELMDKATALLEVGPDIVTDKTHFTTNPQLLYQRRIAVAEMIESLR